MKLKKKNRGTYRVPGSDAGQFEVRLSCLPKATGTVPQRNTLPPWLQFDDVNPKGKEVEHSITKEHWTFQARAARTTDNTRNLATTTRPTHWKSNLALPRLDAQTHTRAHVLWEPESAAWMILLSGGGEGPSSLVSRSLQIYATTSGNTSSASSISL